MYLGKKMLAVPLVNDTKTSKTASKRSFQVITPNIRVFAVADLGFFRGGGDFGNPPFPLLLSSPVPPLRSHPTHS